MRVESHVVHIVSTLPVIERDLSKGRASQQSAPAANPSPERSGQPMPADPSSLSRESLRSFAMH